MSESPPETGTAPPEQPAETAPPAPQPQEPPAEDYEAKWKAQQKVNRDLEKKLEQTRTANMNETEKAVHEAEQRGRSAASKDFGQRLARTEFDALAARRNPDFNTANVLEYVDLSKMVGDDGEPDAKALRSAVERLVPEPPEGVAPDFSGGTRTPASKTQSFGDVLRSEIRGRG
jgi:hypothetical protein